MILREFTKQRIAVYTAFIRCSQTKLNLHEAGIRASMSKFNMLVYLTTMVVPIVSILQLVKFIDETTWDVGYIPWITLILGSLNSGVTFLRTRLEYEQKLLQVAFQRQAYDAINSDVSKLLDKIGTSGYSDDWSSAENTTLNFIYDKIVSTRRVDPEFDEQAAKKYCIANGIEYYSAQSPLDYINVTVTTIDPSQLMDKMNVMQKMSSLELEMV